MRRRSGSWTPVFDYMLALLGLFLILAIVEKPVQPVRSNIPTYGQYAITIEWQGMDDIDLHVQNPSGEDAYFASQAADGVYLEHDDIPSTDGLAHPNRERTIVRQTAPGEYTVNVHFYAGQVPTRVTVTLYDIRSLHQAHKITSVVVPLPVQGIEHTAFRFVLDANGNVRSLNRLQKVLIQ